MSWSIRDPPSPVLVPSLEPEIICEPTPMAEVNTPPTLTAGHPPPSSPRPSSPPSIRLDLVGQEQWSIHPLRIKSTFAIIGDNDFQRLSSPACGMGWSFDLDLCRATTSVTEKIRRAGRSKAVQPTVIDPSVVVMHASLQSGLAGFPRGNYSIRALFRREGCVLAVMEDDWEVRMRSAIALGHCDIPLPLGEIFIDLVVTLSFPDSKSSPEVPRTISASMSKAIRATLDGEFPVDVKFMLFSRKYGETFVCNRRPIYASRNILKGRNSFLDSYMNDSRVEDDHPPAIYQYPYDEDSDLESDFDEDPGAVPGLSDSIPIEALSPPIQISELDTAQPGPPRPPSIKIPSVASIFDVNTDLSSENSPAKSLHSRVATDPEYFGMSDSICMSDYQQPVSPTCDSRVATDPECFGMSDSICMSDQQPVSPTCDVVSEPMGRCTEEYQADKVESQEKVSGSLPHLALINDVAFRTFRALIVYMYTKEVAFIPLKSSGGCSYTIGDACSPKSMYRLAVKASHEGLKKHSFDNLRSQLGPKNIITEIFSKFTADYPEIFEMELKVLLDHFTNPVVRDEWERMIDMVASGRLPHGADVLKKVTRALRT